MLTALLTPLAFIFTLGLIITVHEYGHFQVAKWCGVKVLKFSIGFGKPLVSKIAGKDQTEFILASIPLGGYVKLLSEAEFANTPAYASHDMQRSLEQAALWKRMAIVLAGSMANFLLAIILYWGLHLTGIVGLKPTIGEITENSPAAIANLVMGETIQKINDEPVTTWQDARWLLLNAAFKTKPVVVEAINEAGEVYVRRLDLRHVNDDDTQIDRDILEKIGIKPLQPRVPSRIGEIMRDSAAMRAGLQTDDLVKSVNQQATPLWEDFVKRVRANPNQTLAVIVERQGAEIALVLTPDAIDENGKSIGRIGAGFRIDPHAMQDFLITKDYGMMSALQAAIYKTWETALFSLKMLGNMLTGKISIKSMSGPISIANYAGQSATMGLKVFIGFVALISISIGVLNLLPIPVLDGGHFMYYVMEFFTGKPVSETVVLYGQKIGFTLLIMMMTIAVYNDIIRLITG